MVWYVPDLLWQDSLFEKVMNIMDQINMEFTDWESRFLHWMIYGIQV